MSRYFKPSGFPDHAYDFYQYRRYPNGIYESNYLKANSPDGKQGLWLKHNLLVPKDRTKEPIAELWGIFFERGQKPQVVKQEVPLNRLSIAKDRLFLKGDQILLSSEKTETTLQDSKNRMSWNIETKAIDQPPIIPFAYSKMYTLGIPKKKLVTNVPESIWNGFFIMNDRKIEIKDWIGFREHNWGTEHAYEYAYGNCNLFKKLPRTYFDGYSAKVKIGPFLTPFLSNGVLRYQEKDVQMNGLILSFTTPTEVNFPLWKVSWKKGNQELIVEQSGEKEDFVGLIYHHPDGKKSYCYNTKFSKTFLTLKENQKEILRAESDLGELEFLFPEPVQGIDLHG